MEPSMDVSIPTAPVWSEEMDAAHAAYGTAARVKIIRQLRVGGPMTRSEIASVTALGQGLVAQCLNRLRSLGVVTDGIDMPQLATRDRRFALDTRRADQLLDALTSYVTAGNGVSGHASSASALPLGPSSV